ncbi:MAG: hypothetical protein ACOZB0_09075 [Pseudomonadota bacterium]
MSRLTLLISRPLQPRPARLDTLFARGRPQSAPPAGHALTWHLAEQFGVEVAALPALCLRHDGHDPDRDPWFHADPVHLLAGLHSITLFDLGGQPLDADEATALGQTLNAHFADTVAFRVPHPTRWYARFRDPPPVAPRPLDEVAGRAIDLATLGGRENRALQALGMEIQMLLHDHPVNLRREQLGWPTVNGLWFSGGGQPRPLRTRFDRVLAEDFTARALAAAAGIEPAPPVLAQARLDTGDCLAVLPASLSPETANTEWFTPLLDALRRRRLHELVVIEAFPGGRAARLRPWDALAFWRG